jgi:hypothetical protein
LGYLLKTKNIFFSLPEVESSWAPNGDYDSKGKRDEDVDKRAGFKEENNKLSWEGENRDETEHKSIER